jgi:tetratricopeptide (TPR) repeat protein
MILRGRSLSGNERNCAFLNIGVDEDGALRRFADISASSGLDLIDDSRALASGDWDGDGDLDLWLTNRQAPRVRFLKNNLPKSPERAWVGFDLEGVSCNRDAIGAHLEFAIGKRTHVRTLCAGDGFLSQSSKRIVIGFPSGEDSGNLTVRWPGGTREAFGAISLNRVHRIVQGRGAPAPVTPPTTEPTLAPSRVAPGQGSEAARVLLTQHVEGYKFDYVDFEGELHSYDPADTGGSPTLINTWASWCAPCLRELDDLASHHEALSRKGLKVIALSTEAVSPDGGKPDITDAKELVRKKRFPFITGVTDAQGLRVLTILHNKVIVLERPLPLPSSFLFDKHGRLAAVYKGPVSSEQLLADLDMLEAPPQAVAANSLPFPSRSGFELFPITHLHFARAYEEGDYLEEARKAARKSLVEDPEGKPRLPAAELARTWYYLGTLEQGRRNWSAAAQAYAKAIEVAPGNPLMEIARAVVHTNNPKVLDALGNAHLQIDRAPEAIAFFEKALVLQPGNRSLALTVALAHQKMGNDQSALVIYQDLLTAQPGAPDVLNNLARLLATTRDDSLRDGSRALSLATRLNPAEAPPNPVTLETLAAAQATTGDFPGALRTLDRALAIARATGKDALVAKLIARRKLCEAGQPIRAD